MKLALSIFGRTYALALTAEPDVELEEEWPVAVVGTPSSVEFGFAPAATWAEWEADRG